MPPSSIAKQWEPIVNAVCGFVFFVGAFSFSANMSQIATKADVIALSTRLSDLKGADTERIQARLEALEKELTRLELERKLEEKLRRK
ncbi:hypothetical protein IW261DRAFT_1555914 [Armillaria novae-zelandiae]|uniref:Uncharacterized protein n=1 Tax=Armillaria novae-zelandiae TaxID=153914 RepID=A0AA39UIH3_9AGAR|nr:hypothetical protein IW261DRAFT_1555914 [Armillaria novae-zelandiae]